MARVYLGYQVKRHPRMKGLTTPGDDTHLIARLGQQAGMVVDGDLYPTDNGRGGVV